MAGSPLSRGHRLKAWSQNITWMEIKREMSMHYSTIPFESNANQTFAQLEWSPDELLDMYLHHVSEFLSKIYHTSDMSRISVEGLNHYTVVYGLNCRRLKDSVVSHWSMQWKTMENCLKDISTIGADTKELKAIAELISTPQKHQQSLR